jgi:transcriptional regulator with XRE-family HTH domain
MTDQPQPHAPRTLRDLAEIANPAARAKAIIRAISDTRSLASDLSNMRREAVLALREAGWLQADIAKLLGVTYGRVSQLESEGVVGPVLVERSIPTLPSTRAAPSLFLAEGEAQGVSEASRAMLSVGPAPAPPHVAALLRIEPGALAIRRRKLQKVGGIPVRLPDSWHTLKMALRIPELTADGFVEGGMQRAFIDAGLRFYRSDETFTVRRATPEEADLLEPDPAKDDDDLVVVPLRCSYAVGDVPVHCLNTVCVNSRHHFRVPPMPGDDVF